MNNETKPGVAPDGEKTMVPKETVDGIVMASLSIAESVLSLLLLRARADSTRWGSAQINSTIIGHMLVTWPMILNAVALFVLPAGVRHAALAGIMAAGGGMFAGWLVDDTSSTMKFRRLAILLTAISWACIFFWAQNPRW